MSSPEGVFELLRIGSFLLESDALEDPAPIEQRPVTAGPELGQRAFAAEEDLRLGAVGQDERHDLGVAEVLDEHGLAERFDEGRPVAHDVVEDVVARDHAEVDVGELVGLLAASEPPRNAATIRSSAAHAATKRSMIGCGSGCVTGGRLAGPPPAVERRYAGTSPRS